MAWNQSSSSSSLLIKGAQGRQLIYGAAALKSIDYQFYVDVII